MKQKGLILILVTIILVLIGYVFTKPRAIAPAPANENQQVTTTTEAAPVSFSWRFVTTESDDALPPRTQVALIANGDVYNAGAYAGSCAEIANENLLEGEVSAVLCWWAGGGDELGVFKEGDRHVLKKGVQEEPTAEEDGFRGNFQQIAVIE